MRAKSLTRQRRDRAAKPGVLEWLAEQDPQCATCHKPTEPITKNIHHLAHPNRRDVPENLLLLCERCHGHYHGEKHLGLDGQRLPDLTPGMLMTAKHEADVKHFSLAVICILKHRQSLPPNWYPVPIPAAFLAERERNSR